VSRLADGLCLNQLDKLMPWPFEKFNMEPGTLQELRSSTAFARERSHNGSSEVEIVHLEKGTVLMSLGYEKKSTRFATHHFRFLYDEQFLFIPIAVDTEKYKTVEEVIEAIQITLFAFVGASSHGLLFKAESSSHNDDEYDEFH